MIKKILKGFLAILLVIQIIELPVLKIISQQPIKAIGTRKTTINQYDKVKMGNKEYTYLGNDKYLLNESIGTKLWADAESAANTYKGNASLSYKAKALVNNSSLVSEADLGTGAYNTPINAGIPTIGGNWWLQDKADQSYTRSYVNTHNIYNAGRTENLSAAIKGKCQPSTVHNTGGLLVQAHEQPGQKDNSPDATMQVERLQIPAGTPVTIQFDGQDSRKVTSPLATIDLVPPTGFYLPSPDQSVSSPLTFTGTFTYLKFYSCWRTGTLTIGTPVTESIKYLGSFTVTNRYVDISCPTTSNPPATASTRPKLIMNPLSIFSASSTKDTSVGNTLGSYPDSGSGPYTMQVTDNNLKVSLDNNHESIKNGEIELDLAEVKKSNGVIKIPYDISGSTYDTVTQSYLSAMTDDAHYKKLGAVSQNGKGTLDLDINNIATKNGDGKIEPQSLTVSLYQEEISADGHMDYISSPLNITINIKKESKSQSIDQEAGDPTETIYGTPINLNVKEVGTDHSSNPITFSLSTADQAYATLTDLGNGAVKVTPKTANKTIHVLVDKAGDDVYADAPQLKIPIDLNKKAITITADSFNKEIGDPAPDYTVKAGSGELVTGDTIPIGIKGITPSYTPTDGKLMTPTSGVDITIEEDTSAEVLAFKEKYDITYKKGKLTVGMTTTDETSLDISPSPNANGWNNTDVIIKPSADAIAKGFNKLSLNGCTPSESITLTNSSKKEDMKFILSKADGSMTNEITLTKDIKIDKTAPDVSIDVEKIPESFSMKLLNRLTGGNFYKGGFIVTITATDENSQIDTITGTGEKNGTITENGNTKTLTYTVSEDFKGKIEASVKNKADLETTETSKQVINENDSTTLGINPKSISGFINADSVFEAKLDIDVSANQSGLNEVSYLYEGTEQSIKTYTAVDGEDDNLTLIDTLSIPLTDLIQTAPADQTEMKLTIKVKTNSGNTLTKEVTIQYDITKAVISIISVENENTWALSKQVDFSVNEVGSGIDTIKVINPDGTEATVNGELTGTTFDFLAEQAGNYSIDVVDKAGNTALKLNKEISKIDTDVPTIQDITITPDNDIWAEKKEVTFHVKDLVDPKSGSGVDQSKIKVSTSSGGNISYSCQGNNDDLTCSFEASKNDTFTIEAKDIAGNDAETKQVEVKHIDTSKVDITDVINDGSKLTDPWVKTSREITFTVTAGTSGLKDGMPQVLLGSDPAVVTDNGDDTYTFTASKNGDYTIIAEGKTGDKKEVSGTISKIDSEAPIISDLKAAQETKYDPSVTIAFKGNDKPDSDASGIDKVTSTFDGVETILTSTDGTYLHKTVKSGTYTITVKDKAGNTTTDTITISLPIMTKQISDQSVFEREPLSLSIKVDMEDTKQTDRSYEWFYIDEAGSYTSIKEEILSETGTEAEIAFPYEKADGTYNGRYVCVIMNGDGYYVVSSMFELTVISEPTNGFVMIPSNIEMKAKNDGSELAEGIFDIELIELDPDTTSPTEIYHVQTNPKLTLQNNETSDTYVIDLYKETDGSDIPYLNGDIASLSYQGMKKQKVKLMMPINLYHGPGKYQGTLHFIIRYGEGGI